MKHGGKRDGAGRPKKQTVVVPAALLAPSAPSPNGPTEPDWSMIFSDDLDIGAAREQWSILTSELKGAEKLAVANHAHIKRTVFHQVMWERAARQVAEDGPVFAKKGRRAAKPNPWWGTLKDANAMVAQAEAELTITPRRRSNGGKVQKQKGPVIGGGYLKLVPK